jgi:hypothetical protein
VGGQEEHPAAGTSFRIFGFEDGKRTVLTWDKIRV